MVKVSVIIPVYNVENYIKDCLDSIISQSLEDIEIICVNDGSTDGSLSILEQYAEKDKRICIITQENAGLGASRNKGLSNATGEYVYFIDSDDYIDTETLEKTYENAKSNDSDLVLFKFLKVKNKKTSKKHSEFRIDEILKNQDFDNFTFTYKDIKKHVLNTAFSACLKLYKKEFLESFDDFYFSEDIAFEDILFHVKVMLNASRISFVPEFLYYYRTNEDSITNTSTNDFDIFNVIDSVEEYLTGHDYFYEFREEFELFKIAQIYNRIYPLESEEFYERAKKEFESLEPQNNKVISKRYLNAFNLVLNSRDYPDFIVKHDENKKTSKSDKRPSSTNPLKKLKPKLLNILKKNK